MGADAQSEATKANSDNALLTNRQNYQMFREGRGEGGSAILPLYAKDDQGNLIEPQLFKDAFKTYSDTGVAPDYVSLLKNITEASKAAEGTVGDIFNGGLQTQELQNLQPVADARLEGVATQKAGTLEALQSTLNNIKAIQAGKGYAGDSLGARLLSFGATRDANTTNSVALSSAKLANVTDVNRIKANDINRRIASIGLPGQMAQQAVNIADAPTNALLNRQQQRLQLFGGFRIAPGQFTAQNMPTVQPNSAAYDALTNASAGAQNLGAAYLKNPQFFNSLFASGAVANTAGSGALLDSTVAGSSAAAVDYAALA